MSILGNLETDYDREYSDMEMIHRYWKYAVDHKFHLVLTVFAIIVGAVLTLLVPFTLRNGVDALTAGNFDIIFVSAVQFLVLNILIWITSYATTYENTKFTAKTTRDIRRDLFVQVQEHDMGFFDKNKTGNLMSRIMDDTQSLAEFIALTANISTNILIALGTVIVLFFIDFRLTLMALSVVPFLVIFILVFRRIARALARDWRVSISKLNESFQENISGISVSKSFGRIDKARDEFEDLNEKNYRVNVKRSVFFSSIFPVVYAISNVGLYLVLFQGGLSSIQSGQPSAGTLVLFVAYLQRFYFPIILITNYYNNLQAGLAAAERIFSLMDVKSFVDRRGTQKLPSLPKGKITFDGVTFLYEDGTMVFDDFSLTINAGDTVAIVGHTGAGKSTLISILLRFYEIEKGTILLDGVNIQDYELSSYRSITGMVLQDPLLFSGTIRSNIAYGVDNARDEEITRAAKAANLWEFIQAQPKGLESEIRERGKSLSQGQRQLISIARAFLVDPRLLLLDEATASIDAYSEALIQEATERLLHDRTSIIIAHRLTTVKRADRIIVLDHGQIIESGSHQDLIQHDGHYSELFQKYFAFQEVKV